MKFGSLFNLLFIPVLFCFFAVYPAFAGGTEDLAKFQELLKPITVMGETFELEKADGSVRTDKNNVYSTTNVSPRKIIYVDELNVANGVNNRQVAMDYVKKLNKDGEDARILETNSSDYVAVYSVRSEKGYENKLLSVSKFYNMAPNKVLQNEYCRVITPQQSSEDSIRRIANDFMNTEMIKIRHVIIKENGKITDIRSY